MIKRLPKVIAEIANSHQGDYNRALETAIKFYNAGADIVKFQVYTANDLVSINHPRWEHFYKQAFSSSQWNYIFDELEKLNIPYAIDVFGNESFEFICDRQPVMVKIHLSDIDNIPLHKKIAGLNVPIAIGTGGAHIALVKKIVSFFITLNVNKIILLHGFQAYPTTSEDTNLDRLSLFSELFNHSNVGLGISDHIEGDNILSSIAPIMALVYGIDYIEKHVTLNRSEKKTDYYSSMEEDTFKSFLILLNASYKLIGSPDLFSEDEKVYFAQVKKCWMTSVSMVAGQIIDEKSIKHVRVPSEEINAASFEEIIGQRVKFDISAETIIKRNILSINQ
jgi:N,N'-diacetyllegionaminate synthase